MSENKSLIKEIFDFIKERKAWWLTPIIFAILLGGILITLGQGSFLSPFIYALF